MEALSQSQIDDLLNSLKSGNSSNTEETEKTPENIDEYFHIFVCFHCFKTMSYPKSDDSYFKKTPVFKWFISKHQYNSLELLKNTVQTIKNEETKKYLENFIIDVKTTIFKKREENKSFPTVIMENSNDSESKLTLTNE